MSRSPTFITTSNPLVRERKSDMRSMVAAYEIVVEIVRQYMGYNMILTVPVVVFFSLVASVFNGFAPYAALYSIVIFLVDNLYFEPTIKDLRYQAARIMELFDTKVLGLPWNKYKLGMPNEHERIELYRRKSDAKYGVYRWNYYQWELITLPVEFSRAICQRENVWWDKYLRVKYAQFVTAVMSGSLLLLFMFGLIGHLTLEQFILAVIVPMVPIFTYCVKQLKENGETVPLLNSINSAAEQLWHDTVSGRKTSEELLRLSRQLQDEIFDIRSNGNILFVWFINRLDVSESARDTTMKLLSDSENVLSEDHPDLILEYQYVDEKLAEQWGITSGDGVLVTGVTDLSPCKTAGIREGDVITMIESYEVSDVQRLPCVLRQFPRTIQKLRVTVRRDHKPLTFTVKFSSDK